MGDDLFDWQRTYPVHPGGKGAATSFEAADAVAPRAPLRREQCLRALREIGDMTPDECAVELGLEKISIRPRFSELSRMGMIKDTGERRPNSSGSKAIVWKLSDGEGSADG
jgi:hypothetical protein